MASGGGVNIGMLVAAGIGTGLSRGVDDTERPAINPCAGHRLHAGSDYIDSTKNGMCMINPDSRRFEVIGGQMESAMPALGASSNWNSSYNTGLKTSVKLRASGLYRSGCLGEFNPVFDHRRAGDISGNHTLCASRSELIPFIPVGGSLT